MNPQLLAIVLGNRLLLQHHKLVQIRDVIERLSGVEVFQSNQLNFTIFELIIYFKLIPQKQPQIAEQNIITNLLRCVLLGLSNSFSTAVRVHSGLKTILVKTVWF